MSQLPKKLQDILSIATNKPVVIWQRVPTLKERIVCFFKGHQWITKQYYMNISYLFVPSAWLNPLYKECKRCGRIATFKELDKNEKTPI